MDEALWLREQADRLLPGLPEVTLVPARTAMVTIDMQYIQHPEYGLAAGVKNMGLTGIYDYYTGAIRQVIPRIAQLQAACRRAGIPLIHVKIMPRTRDGRDYSPEYLMLNENVVTSERDGDIMEEVQPLPGEMVITKVSASVFNSSNIDQILRHLQIDTLIFAGVVTNGCVESSLRSASDRGYQVILASDATNCWTEKGDVEALRGIRRWFARVCATDELIARIEALENG